ncbi:hypothetical protein AB0G81_38540, partial [Streptomyces asoensis]
MSERIPKGALVLAAALLLCALPFYLDAFWLRIGLFSMHGIAPSSRCTARMPATVSAACSAVRTP